MDYLYKFNIKPTMKNISLLSGSITKYISRKVKTRKVKLTLDILRKDREIIKRDVFRKVHYSYEI